MCIDIITCINIKALAHASGVIALGAGAVSFTHVVKALEPAFTAAISGIFFKEFLSWQAYIALVRDVSVSLSSTLHTHLFATLPVYVQNQLFK